MQAALNLSKYRLTQKISEIHVVYGSTNARMQRDTKKIYTFLFI